MTRTLPLLQQGSFDCVASYRGRQIDRQLFLRNVEQLATTLPDQRHVVNLCEDRYEFMVAFAAALVRKQITLLPAAQTEGLIAELRARYQDVHLIDHVAGLVNADNTTGHIAKPRPIPQIPVDQLAAITFTSGSTGSPQAHPKRWGELVQGAQLADQRLSFHRPDGLSIVATVPAQHMYGFEFSVVAPWVSAACVHAGRPFFPSDVRDALAEMPAPRVLISTPLHLRACVAATTDNAAGSNSAEDKLEWPDIDFVVSATAPLSASLAEDVEREMATRVLEIYGSTETGSVAYRQTSQDQDWLLHDGLRLSNRDDAFHLSGGHLTGSVALADKLEIRDFRRFRLLGRNSDMVKIAGKRISLAELNLRLNDIDGVVDGFVVPPQDPAIGGRATLSMARRERARPLAVVVAPGLNQTEILDRLARFIDPVFLPRPIHFVDTIPRNATGKLSREAIRKLLGELDSRRAHKPISRAATDN